MENKGSPMCKSPPTGTKATFMITNKRIRQVEKEMKEWKSEMEGWWKMKANFIQNYSTKARNGRKRRKTYGLKYMHSEKRYCTEILASLPFSLPDEPLYLVFAINRMVQVRAGVVESNIKALIHEDPLRIVAKEVTDCLAAERLQDSENAYNLDVAHAQKSDESSFVDDTVGIPEETVLKLKAECLAAVALALLLRLKRHVKILYNLNDARCQVFTPTEPIKPGETLSRQSLKDFSFKEIPTGSTKTIKQMLEQYQAFKRLMKEDTMDYSAYASSIVRKRNRSSVVPAVQYIEEVENPENGHIPTLRSARRKSAPVASKAPDANDQEQYSDDDVADDDYDEDQDDDYHGKAKRRRRSAAAGRTRSTRRQL
ncbi:hypothetical protein L7F22_064167 [Adiantum nelumboides]|nr:hypothetical protein [Adiantum nelumboides]